MAGPVSRPLRIAAIVVALLAFVAISAGVARQLGATSAERNAAVATIKDEARGDGPGLARRIRGCAADGGCAARVGALAARLRTRDRVRILRYDGLGGVSLGGRHGVARVAWKAGTRLPVVQCVRLRRTGDLLSGYRIHVLALSAPIGREAACPKNG